jgi:hypothetical protein
MTSSSYHVLCTEGGELESNQASKARNFDHSTTWGTRGHYGFGWRRISLALGTFRGVCQRMWSLIVTKTHATMAAGQWLTALQDTLGASTAVTMMLLLFGMSGQ